MKDSNVTEFAKTLQQEELWGSYIANFSELREGLENRDPP